MERLTLNEIEQALEQKNYTIKTESDCDCSLSWELRKESGIMQLYMDVDPDNCWWADVLYIGGHAIADRAPGYIQSSVEGISDSEISSLLSDLGIILSDYSENEPVPEHDAKMRSGLSNYLTDELLPAGWTLWRDTMRGFANEFTNILLAPGLTADEEWESCSIEDWIYGYFYRGDTATQAYTSTSVVTKEE